MRKLPLHLRNSGFSDIKKKHQQITSSELIKKQFSCQKIQENFQL